MVVRHSPTIETGEISFRRIRCESSAIVARSLISRHHSICGSFAIHATCGRRNTSPGWQREASVSGKSYNERKSLVWGQLKMAEMTIAPVATHGFFVDGRWQQEGDPVEVRAPYDGSLIARVTQGRKEHAEAAIAAAVKAFGTTRRLPAFERQRVLRQIASGIHERRDEFARTLSQEAGKPIKSARAEVERGVFTFNIAAEETVRGYGEYLPLDWQQTTAGRWGLVRRFPLGPIAGISPFNFPLNLVAHKVAPAMAAGCSMVLKPAPQTPLSSLLLGEIIQQAG